MSPKKLLDESRFSSLDEESEYWIGYLITDGNIHFPKSKKYPNAKLSPKLSLSSKDEDVLIKFKKYMKSEHLISFKRGSFCIGFTSSKVCSNLIRFGVTPSKTYNVDCSNTIKNSRHFWRGCIDGDGYISDKPFSRLNFVSKSLKFLEKFKTFCDSIVTSKAEIRVHRNKKRGTFIYSLSYKGSKAAHIIRFLYKDSNVYMDRKYEIAKRIILDSTAFLNRSQKCIRRYECLRKK